MNSTDILKHEHRGNVCLVDVLSKNHIRDEYDTFHYARFEWSGSALNLSFLCYCFDERRDIIITFMVDNFYPKLVGKSERSVV